MAFYIKKSMMGYKICDEEEAEYKAWNLEEAKLLLDKYNENPILKENIKNLKNQIIELDSNYKNKNNNLIELQKKYDNLLEEYRLLSSEKDEISHFNNVLLHISKSRANAERKLTPRKTHHGYIIKKSETRYIYKTKIYDDPLSFMNKIEKKLNIEVYDYLLETPYNSNLLKKEVKNIIIEDFKKFNFSYTEKMSLEDVSKDKNIFRIISLSSDEKSKFYKLKIQTNNEFNL